MVIFIISVLMALLMPAVHSARESGRQTVCMNNLRQFGVGFHALADRNRDALCTGAFDWQRDGAVTEVGWVADLVRGGAPVGTMLCPSNIAQVSATYNDLLTLNPASAGSCVDLAGSPASTAPDGTPIVNACRQIIDGSLAAGSEARRLHVETEIYEKNFNTNYTASWFLVRGGVILDNNGNLTSNVSGCPATLDSRTATMGPLVRAYMETTSNPISTVPLLGCGAVAGTLANNIGLHPGGTPLARSFTAGPVKITTQEAPEFASGTPREGASGWWGVWTKQTLQDYRGFAPVHRGACNLLFADGSVRAVLDTDGDGLLNNGFPASILTGFKTDTIEIPPQSVFSQASLRGF